MIPSVAVPAIDLFAGAGGWCVAARSLGIDPLGIELDDAACATREAVGFRTLKADVAALDPRDFAPCALGIASPPCPTFSRAGKREGIADLPVVYEAARMVADGTFVPGALRWRDARSELVAEPLRWALALEPTYLAWEQVPDVLPFWEACATILRERGWNVWTGILEAERYGVAQTRERAILMASRKGHVGPPQPTHQRYVKGEPQRHEVTLEGEILPWVSMAEALGWDNEDEIGFPRRDDHDGDGEYRDRDRRPASEPSFTLGEKARSWDRVVMRMGDRVQPGGGNVPRTAGQPSATLATRTDLADWIGNKPAPTIVTTRRSDKGILIGRQLADGEGRNVGGRNWGGGGPTPAERPATTVAGDPRLSSPTHHNHGEQNSHAIRVSLEEAAVLQSFPPDFPFQGSKSARFTQVGNAIPPLLARAILSSLLGEPQ